jgi:oligopeptidase B
MGENHESSTTTLRYVYTSMTTPMSTYDFDMATRTQELMKRDRVLGGFDPADYESKYLWATARDGNRVPVSIVYRKDQLDRGQNPLLLYSYGSYGSSSWATFNASRLSLLDRGFVWATAHIRGGQELGRQWYEDGKLLHKKNTFTDFIDCGRYLSEENWCDGDRIYGYGGSAGGLLIGAAVNMAPELFDGAVARVPFVDVVTTMLDESIPLTTSEWDEWGDPREKVYYDYMLSYSPYDQVEAKDYPNLLVTAGLHDSQVQYFEPAKWVAKLRSLKTDDNLLLLYTNMEAGHGGASGRLSRQKETALIWSFVIHLSGSANMP